MSSSPVRFAFSSPEGRKILREITNPPVLPFLPHDYSLKAAAAILDGHDVLCRTATAGGKTGTIAVTAIAMQLLQENPSTVPQFQIWYKPSPIILVICPTNALEINISIKMNAMGIKTCHLNSDVINKAVNSGMETEVWAEAKKSRIILLSPELLNSKTVREQLEFYKEDSALQARISLLVVDEAHLIYEWGKRFRKAFSQIGHTRNRLHNTRLRLLLLTATLRDGKPLDYVLGTFGLKEGRYLNLHRSNLRPEIRVTTSTLLSSLSTSFTFPELRWVLGLPGLTIIFVPDQNSALRLTLYLRSCNEYLARWIRKYDAMNDKDTYDQETMQLVNELQTDITGLMSLLIIATAILMVGIDLPGARRAIILSPKDIDEELQKLGRLLRNGLPGEIGEGFIYVSKRQMEQAKKMVEAESEGKDPSSVGGQKRNQTDDGKEGSHLPSMDISMAHRLTAQCQSVEINRRYANPPFAEPPCSCASCTEHPLPLNHPCLCSGCQPGMNERDILFRQQSIPREISGDAADEARRRAREAGRLDHLSLSDESGNSSESQPITKESTETIRNHLFQLDEELYEKNIGNEAGIFVPASVVGVIVQNFWTATHSRDSLKSLLQPFPTKTEWADAIWTTLYTKTVPEIRTRHDKRQETEEEETLQKRLKKMSVERVEQPAALNPV
ncbi:hypothetical protein AAF712_010177 [Marasmius tenuissimus]|uniref:DNA 3'-5' helicase n=1 Tax=Marasmius tenuissimus TaxID=585030 RepID=A0ABR2ZPF2_9AGAR